jgi:xanthine dehydrogenase accessory factor
MLRDTTVVVRGGGELGSAAARLLFHCGFPVAVLERPAPLAVRRQVCFAEAVWSGEIAIEGVLGRRLAARAIAELRAGLPFVAVLIDEAGDCLQRLRPEVLVDARMAKRNLGTRREQAPLVIGLGPGFTAGEDVHAVVETQRGGDLGRLLWTGSACADTALPTPVLGVDADRVLRSPRGGVFRAGCRIGALVPAGWRIGEVDGLPVTARVGGLVRGLLHDGVPVEPGTKLGDIDPRGAEVDPARLSDKGRAVAAGVLEAVLVRFKGSG